MRRNRPITALLRSFDEFEFQRNRFCRGRDGVVSRESLRVGNTRVEIVALSQDLRSLCGKLGARDGFYGHDEAEHPRHRKRSHR